MNRRTFVGALAATVAANKLRLSAQAGDHAPSTGNKAGDQRKAPSDLVPIAAAIDGISAPVINLAGAWSFTTAPGKEFWKSDADLSAWSKVNVPGEFVLQGFNIKEDIEYPCRTKVKIPKDFSGQRIYLRFDGIYGYARIWINGSYVRDHFGGFTSWDCEITQYVKPGESADLVVGITDRRDDISQGSYYAQHSIAGILRDVRLFAVPASGLAALSTVPRLSEDFAIGYIDITATLASPEYKSAQLELGLTDPAGAKVSVTPSSLDMSSLQSGQPVAVRINAPRLWDAEHPHLYELTVAVSIDGKHIQAFRNSLGFRTVKVVGNQLLVNGSPIKLRGVCRHSIHPVHGRAVPPEFDEQDAILFRRANINFVRTSHYSPSEHFLAACDRHGIYVEEETAVSWSNLGDGPSSDSAFADRFLSQFQEMIGRDRHHASVLFWSLGNESQWGDNIALERHYAKEADPSRPNIFSYPDTIPWGTPRCDIYSKHYPEWGSNLGGSISPVLHDEFAHVPCYNIETYRRDPGVRNFWGESIKRFGDSFLTTDGCLGGSIWAGIDEVFILTKKAGGYGPWGIVDGWRREKPEYWLTKKAYSPIRIEDKTLPLPGKSTTLQIPIYNAFDHTNLSEIEIRWSIGHDAGKLSGINIAPHSSGYLEIPSRSWKPGEILDLQFSSASNPLIDQFKLPMGSVARTASSSPGGSLHVTEKGNTILIEGAAFSVTLDRETGLIQNATSKGQTVLEAGPFLDLGAGYYKNWTLRHFDLRKREDGVTAIVTGESRFTEGIVKSTVELEIDIDSTGLITARYRASGPATKGTHLGLAYLLPAKTETLHWERKALWSAYPDDHIGRPSGTASRKASHGALTRGTKPSWAWSQDTGDIYEPGATPSDTHDFASIKENIWSASCTFPDSAAAVSVEANGDAAVRASSLADGRVAMSIFNFWSYPDMAWGNYPGPHDLPAAAIREVRLRLTERPPKSSSRS